MIVVQTYVCMLKNGQKEHPAFLRQNLCTKRQSIKYSYFGIWLTGLYIHWFALKMSTRGYNLETN